MQTVHFLRNFLCLVACVGNSGDDWLCAYFKRNVQQKYYIIRQIYRLCSIRSYSEQNATCQYSNFTFYLSTIIAIFSNVSSGYTYQKAFVPEGIFFWQSQSQIEFATSFWEMLLLHNTCSFLFTICYSFPQ